MSWRELTEADVIGVMSAAEKSAYQVAVIGVGQNPMNDAIRVVANQCRGYIADNQANSLAAGLTLPERVHMSALHLIRVEMLTRLDLEVSKDRESAKRDAIRFFERVSEGMVAIEQPEGALDTGSPASTIETISTNDRQATRAKLAGL